MTTISRQNLKRAVIRGGLFSSILICSSWVQALRFEPTDEIKIDFDTTVSYGAMWRVEDRDHTRLYSKTPIDEWPQDGSLIDAVVLQDGIMAWNSDDGDRNFDKGDMVSDRYAAISDFDLSYKNVGVFLRSRIFYDAVYFEETSWTGEGFDHYVFQGNPGAPVPANTLCVANSTTAQNCGYQGPETINNMMAGGQISDPSHFSQKAKDINGYDAGFLDAYVYGSFNIGEHNLDLRIGRQAISWGEALMLQGGIGFAQNRIDVTAATAPGQQLKEIFLPVGAVYGQIDLTPEITLEAYWQYEWKKSQIMASDSYFGFIDFLDSGAMLLNSAITNGCGYGIGTTINGILDPVPQPEDICDGPSQSIYFPANAARAAPEVEPDNPSDQYGVALRTLLDNGSEFGVYYVRYHDKYPSFWAANNGGVEYVGGILDPAETEGFNLHNYTVSYKEGINLIGLTYNTVIGDVQMGFELTYRENQPVVPSCSVEDMAASYSTYADTDNTNTVLGNPGFVGSGGTPAIGDLNSPKAKEDFHTDCKDPSVAAIARKQYWGKDADDPLNAAYDPNSESGWNVGGGSLKTLQEKLFAWPTSAEVWTYNIGATAVTPPTPLWDTGIFVMEVGGWYVGSGFQNKDLKVSDLGSFTQQGVGISALFLPQYKNVWEGIDLTIPIFVNYTIDGSFAYFGYTQGALWFSVGVEAVYLSNTSFGVTYNVYGGDHIWKDRDNVSFNVKYTF